MKALAFFATCLAVQAGYALLLRRGFVRVAAAPTPPLSDRPVSIVVAARNEAARLPTLVAALGRQSHPDFEMIVVDDHSTDATADLLRRWAARDTRVRMVEHRGLPGKKHALTAGIAQARHSVVALTDADCAPPPRWLGLLAGYHAFHGDRLLVFYCPYRRRPGLLNLVARYETFVTGFLTAAAVGLGRPYMAVGRGMSYRRSLFTRLGGFAGHGHLLSGDDDLLVQAAARLPGVAVLHPLGPDAYVPSDAPASWQAWLRQKRRHLSDGPHYSRNVQVHLGFFHLTALSLWLAPLAGPVGAGLLGARLAVWAYALAPAGNVLEERDLWHRLLLLEPLYGLYNALLAPFSLLAGKLKRW